jgi:hypothetical protein
MSELKGPELKSASIALEKFSSEQVAADLQHYTMMVITQSQEYEVIFVPMGPPTLAGGRTEFGPEVHYFISKNTYEITRKHFAR